MNQVRKMIKNAVEARDKEILDFINSGFADPSTDSGWSISLTDTETFITKNKGRTIKIPEKFFEPYK